MAWKCKSGVFEDPSDACTKVEIGETFCKTDSDCHFDELCQNGQCILDETTEWKCKSGVFTKPSIGCQKLKLDGEWSKYTYCNKR